MSASAHAAGQRHAVAPAMGRDDARARALSHRDAIRRRARRIRRSVAALAVTLFAVAFLVVYVQLASGHDPALVVNAEKRAAALGSTGNSTSESSASTGTSESSASSTGTSEASGESSASGGGESSASAVTTSQS
jgi:hypothetical protein